MSRIILVDGNNLLYRSYYANNEDTSKAIVGIFKSLSTWKRRWDARMLVGFDSCRSERKTKLFPEYKADRKSKLDPKDYENIKKMQEIVINILKHTGIDVFHGHGYECDDYIACICPMLKAKYEILIISTDQDFNLLLDPRIRIYNPTKDILIDNCNFEQIYEIPLKYYLDFKCMIGDSSDCIPGIEGIGEVTAKKFIQAFGDYQSIVAGLKQKVKLGKREQAVIDSEEIFKRNMDLIDLRYYTRDSKLKELIKSMINQSKKSKGEIYRILCENSQDEIFDTIEAML